MQLRMLDWAIIAVYLSVMMGVGLFFTKRAGKSVVQFFISGRSLPWWLAGTSLVATTFASDSPLQIVDFIRTDGISGNWFIWSSAIGTVFAAVCFSRMWWRARILTSVELFELRYGGRPAAFLRLLMAGYVALIVNGLIMGWVIEGMATMCREAFGWPEVTSILILLGIALVYSVLSGFWGVVMTDFLQFFMATCGSIMLAVCSVKYVGGMGALKDGIVEMTGDSSALNFFPGRGTHTITMFAFMVFIFVRWWGESQGDGYHAQRYFACRKEKDAVLAGLWFNVAEWCLNYWPWIVVGLASIVVFPQMEKGQAAYPRMIVTVLPHGAMGFVVAAFIAAFMSTMDSHLNWGSSFMINDLYRRFIVRSASEKHYVLASRICMVLMAVYAGIIGLALRNIFQGWALLMALGSGMFVVQLVRWFWWRVNAWAEIAALAASIVCNLILFKFDIFQGRDHFAHQLLVIVSTGTITWVITMLLTPPEDKKTLARFYNRVRPEFGFWGPVQDSADWQPRKGQFGAVIKLWLASVLFIYTTQFSIGKFILGYPHQAVPAAGLAVISLIVVARILRRQTWWNEDEEASVDEEEQLTEEA
ncbi:sodium:solute symporter family protein [Candidatus Hydrogenedentota bacterium]